MSESKKYILEYIRAFTMKCLEQTDVDLFFNPEHNPVNISPNVDITAGNENSDKETVKEVTEAVSEMAESTAETAVETAKEVEPISLPHISKPSMGSASKTLPEFVQELYDTIFDLRDFSENADTKKDGKDSKIVAM